MTAALGDEVNRLAAAFNASQGEVELTALYKGSYPDTMTATIAAFRAGQAPQLVQIFEVGTASMLAAGKAVKQVWELAKETGTPIDPAAYIPAVRGYYSLPDGRMASMPFNSSTAITWINKDAFEKAGLDPSKPPATWDEVIAAGRAIKAKGAADVPVTTSWPSWIQFEQYSALHDIPFATKANGFEGLDAELVVNSAKHVKHVQRLIDMAKEGVFKYAGRDNAPDPLLISGQAAISFATVRLARRSGEERQVRLGAGDAALRPDADRDPVELDHRRRQPVADDRAGPHPGRIQGRRVVPAVPLHPGERRRLAPAHRLRAGDARRLRAVEEAGVL